MKLKNIIILCLIFLIIYYISNSSNSKFQSTITGCTDSKAINYNSIATKDDNSCKYITNIIGNKDEEFGYYYSSSDPMMNQNTTIIAVADKKFKKLKMYMVYINDKKFDQIGQTIEFSDEVNPLEINKIDKYDIDKKIRINNYSYGIDGLLEPKLLSISEDGRTIVTCRNNNINIYKLEDGNWKFKTELKTLAENNRKLSNYVDLSHNGKYLLVGTMINKMYTNPYLNSAKHSRKMLKSGIEYGIELQMYEISNSSIKKIANPITEYNNYEINYYYQLYRGRSIIKTNKDFYITMRTNINNKNLINVAFSLRNWSNIKVIPANLLQHDYKNNFFCGKVCSYIFNTNTYTWIKNEDIIPKPLQKSRKLAKDYLFPNIGNRIGSSISFNNTGSIISIGTDGTYFSFKLYGLGRVMCLAILKAEDPSICTHPWDPSCAICSEGEKKYFIMNQLLTKNRNNITIYNKNNNVWNKLQTIEWPDGRHKPVSADIVFDNIFFGKSISMYGDKNLKIFIGASNKLYFYNFNSENNKVKLDKIIENPDKNNRDFGNNIIVNNINLIYNDSTSGKVSIVDNFSYETSKKLYFKIEGEINGKPATNEEIFDNCWMDLDKTRFRIKTKSRSYVSSKNYNIQEWNLLSKNEKINELLKEINIFVIKDDYDLSKELFSIYIIDYFPNNDGLSCHSGLKAWLSIKEQNENNNLIEIKRIYFPPNLKYNDLTSENGFKLLAFFEDLSGNESDGLYKYYEDNSNVFMLYKSIKIGEIFNDPNFKELFLKIEAEKDGKKISDNSIIHNNCYIYLDKTCFEITDTNDSSKIISQTCNLENKPEKILKQISFFAKKNHDYNIRIKDFYPGNDGLYCHSGYKAWLSIKKKDNLLKKLIEIKRIEFPEKSELAKKLENNTGFYLDGILKSEEIFK